MGLLRDLLGLSSKEQYGTPSVTMNGEQVKSKAEQRIADYLARNGIRYVYEFGAKTNALIFKRTFAKPDFYLPDYGVYVEYWGLIGVAKDYKRTMKWKMRQYRDNGIKYISLYPDNMDNLDWIFRKKFTDVTGRELPTRTFRTQTAAKYCSNCGAATSPSARYCTRCGKTIN
jgi:zinc-ribbon domain